MRKMMQAIARIAKTKEIVARERHKHMSASLATRAAIHNANRHLANGVTIKIHKAMHGGNK